MSTAAPSASSHRRTLVEVNTAGLHALVRELGVADTARFLQQFGPGRGDYTAERDELLPNGSMEETIAWLREHEARRG